MLLLLTFQGFLPEFLFYTLNSYFNLVFFRDSNPLPRCYVIFSRNSKSISENLSQLTRFELSCNCYQGSSVSRNDICEKARVLRCVLNLVQLTLYYGFAISLTQLRSLWDVTIHCVGSITYKTVNDKCL